MHVAHRAPALSPTHNIASEGKKVCVWLHYFRLEQGWKRKLLPLEDHVLCMLNDGQLKFFLEPIEDET